MNCLLCGQPLPESKGKRGRPRMYHPPCRKIEQLFSWLEDLLIPLDPTPERKKAIRSRFWVLANILNKK